MHLSSEFPYWLIKNGIIHSYPSLRENLICDVAIIGGGITGAFCAYYLQNAGAKVIVVDRRHIGMGSTCASTALLQYEIDYHLTELISLFGKKNAIKSYRLCLHAIDEIKKIADQLPIDCAFKSKKSLYLASKKQDVEKLELEYLTRKKIGIKVKLIYEKEIRKLIGCKAPAALLSQKAAEIDAYVFTHGLLQLVEKRGGKIFDTTYVEKIKEFDKGAKLTCSNGYSITCNKFVFASGYESEERLKKKVARLHSTYVIITKPMKLSSARKLNYLIWESARPYIYIRTTNDNRIIIGGKDENFYSPGKRDKLIRKKSLQLQSNFEKKFGISIEIDFAWAGTFAESRDGLPYIGINKQFRHAYFALGLGGNGITFTQIAGKIIGEMYKKGKSENEHLFSFDRHNKK